MIILSPVFIVMLGFCRELLVSLFINFHNILFLSVAVDIILSASLFFLRLLSLFYRSFDNSECTLRIS